MYVSCVMSVRKHCTLVGWADMTSGGGSFIPCRKNEREFIVATDSPQRRSRLIIVDPDGDFDEDTGLRYILASPSAGPREIRMLGPHSTGSTTATVLGLGLGTRSSRSSLSVTRHVPSNRPALHLCTPPRLVSSRPAHLGNLRHASSSSSSSSTPRSDSASSSKTQTNLPPPPPPPSSSPHSSSTPSAGPVPIPEPIAIPKSSLIRSYASVITSLSARTGVPFPSLAISFLALHELTAIVPIIGLYYLFGLMGAGAGLVSWIKSTTVEGTDDLQVRQQGSGAGAGAGAGDGQSWEWRRMVAGWYEEGEKRIEKVGKRYGILGYDKVDREGSSRRKGNGGDSGNVLGPGVGYGTGADDSEQESESEIGAKDDGHVVGAGSGSRTAEKVANALAAYVVVKAILPLRIAVSIGAAPAFARYTLVPVQRLVARWRSPR
ncbi:hypothetical protein IAR55_005708 [Kwoniella newhampshirensis]|uniref:DUF1279 domain-containing protein n=1 Tax=Kwoniella newhampshirensis TaxID=1651941 RepID=A0AAW0YGL1_9TREE